MRREADGSVAILAGYGLAVFYLHYSVQTSFGAHAAFSQREDVDFSLPENPAITVAYI
jgi:hypothetical protein